MPQLLTRALAASPLCACIAPCAHTQAGVLCASPPEAGQPPVRLLVIDSVAASFKELETGTVGDQAHRANLLYQLAAMLKHMARR